MTRTQLNEKLAEIASMTNKAVNEEQAVKMGQDKYLHLEYASAYGGYRVVNVKIGSGAHYGAFGGNGCEKRLSAKLMALKLDNIIAGIKVAANS